ncbi:unnamed protein product [Meloidogyne enterolobii]|uniref:Uncharacterized protein n=1 Tax=Meloidogyne enterolobii TaxID=390850 RepID=A0ACB1AU54_MELEN
MYYLHWNFTFRRNINYLKAAPQVPSPLPHLPQKTKKKPMRKGNCVKKRGNYCVVERMKQIKADWSAEPFLTWFRKHKRIVRLDLKVPYNEDLFRTVRQLFIDFGFGRNNDSIRVVLFLQNETQVDAIDTEYYHMRKIRLGDICHDKDESL